MAKPTRIDPLMAELARLRDERGMVLRELAPAVGRDWSTVGSYETGATDPPLSRVRLIADALGVDLCVRSPAAPHGTEDLAPHQRELVALVTLLARHVSVERAATLADVFRAMVPDPDHPPER